VTRKEVCIHSVQMEFFSNVFSLQFVEFMELWDMEDQLCSPQFGAIPRAEWVGG
jgi:hypothetical protein